MLKMISNPRRTLALVAAAASLLVIAGCGSSSNSNSNASSSASASSGASSGGAAAGKGPITIGVLAPITGNLAPYGVGMKNGMQLAVDLINADGGIAGRKVAYTLLDDQTSTQVSATQARKLLLQDRVNFLLGTVNSADTLAVIPQAEAAHALFIYPVYGEDRSCTSSNGVRPLIFGYGDTPEQQLVQFVPYVLSHLGKRVYFIGSDYVFPHFVDSVFAHFVQQDGGTIVGTAYAPLGTSDFSSYIAKIKSAHPQVLFIAVTGTDGVALVKQLGQFGLRSELKVTGTPSFESEVIGGFSQAAQGVYTVDRYFQALDNPLNQRYVAAYEKMFPTAPKPVPTTAEEVYGSLLMLKAAVAKAGTINPDSVAKALDGISVDTPGGTVTMNPKNHIATTNEYLLQVHGAGYRLVKALGTIPQPGDEGCSAKSLP